MSSFSLLYVLMPFVAVAFGGYRYFGNQGAASEASELWAARRGFPPAEAPAGGSTPMLELPEGTATECCEIPLGAVTGTLFTWSWVIADNRSAEAQMFDIPGGLEMNEVTMVQATLAAGFPHFRVVHSHGFVAPNGEADEQEVHLESVEFGKRFRLLAGSDGDREALMRLFTPELIVWFTDLGDGAPVVEYWMGTLVVSTRVACIADDEYDALLDAAQRIAAQVLAQGVSQRPSLA